MVEEAKISKRRGRPPSQPKTPISLEDRLNYGSIDLYILSQLSGLSEGKIRLDEKAGLITFVKIGGRTRIIGPEARRYMGYLKS